MSSDPELRLPPFNREAEQSVLGSMLRDNKIIDDITLILSSEEFFYTDAHRKIYRGILELHTSAQPVDTVTLAEWLNQQKFVEDIGGYAYLITLLDAAPSAANAEYYAKIVRDKGMLRSLIHAGTEIARDAYDQAEGAEELLGSAERKILQIAQMGSQGAYVSLKVAIDEAFHRLDARVNKTDLTLAGVPSGYIDLDEKTGGFQSSELIILAARPSVGKTAMALNIVRHVTVDAQLPVFFVSLEMSRLELAERLLICQARVEGHKLRKGTIDGDDSMRLMDAGEILNRTKLFIDDAPGQSMLRIAANSRRLQRSHNIAMVVIDYLQLIEPENRRDSRQEQVGAISRRLKVLAKELKIPVIALAQVNRSAEDRQDHRPRVSDLRESGSIEQDADTVLILHRPEIHEPGQHEGVVELIIGKQRNGPTGEITLTYLKQFMRFENFAVEPPFSYGN